MIDNQEIAAALGKSLWTTDLFIPEYREEEIDDWRINPGGGLGHDWGYFSGPCLLEILPSLSRKKIMNKNKIRWDTWMSLTPHEIESQELGCRHAFGHTVIMGLGMGWVAANAAINTEVGKVTVVEIDADVIELFSLSGALESLPKTARQKITIVNANALDWRPETAGEVDFLYADIWLNLAEPDTVNQVRQMQTNVQASVIYFWEQELAIYAAAKKPRGNDEPLTDDELKFAVNEIIQLPLLIPAGGNYPDMIERVIKNRLARFLPPTSVQAGDENSD